MDYKAFRQSSRAPASAVSVNHRALITRALTKYPVDYALYRELLQNSADAQASKASITFHPVDQAGFKELVAKNPKGIHSVPVNGMTFTNNGLDFGKDDWNRLREIASGNPNEAKIGAFGVGFYSVFELTDKPLVHSGNSIMTFAYNGDQLEYTFSETDKHVKGTVIDLTYRENGICPDLVKFTAFLVQSFTLVPLESVELKLGDVTLLSLSKVTSPQQPLVVPAVFKKSLNRKSPAGTLSVAELHTTAFRVTIKYLNATQMKPLLSQGFFGLGKQLAQSLTTFSDDPHDETQLVCFLRRVDMIVNVNVSSAFRQKIIDTVLKPPPKQAVMSILTHSKAEHDLSEGIRPPLSHYIFPNDFNDAKIFVGFPTRQSTSLKSHIAMNQLIPTMERTIIDMSNESVKDWNGQMLYMAGVMARCVYEYELSTAKTIEEASYTLSRFQFGSSAPDATIGKWIASGFWHCSSQVQVPTTQGVKLSADARFAGDAAKIIRKVPLALDNNPELNTFWEHIKSLGYVREISVAEIIDDIGSDTLDKTDLQKVVRWMSGARKRLNPADRDRLLNAAVVAIGDKIVPLGSIRYFHYYRKLPEEAVAATLPPDCLPSELVGGDAVSIDEWTALGLRPLTLTAWLDNIAKGSELTTDRKRAIDTLGVLGREWQRLDVPSRKHITRSLSSVACIPTQLGMKTPSESYIKPIALFPQSPVVSTDVVASTDFLRELGLRESLDMAYVLQSLHQPDQDKFKWNTRDLVEYLCENAKVLKDSDWQVLRNGEFFAEADTDGRQPLRTASALYGPNESLKTLGFPQLSYQNWMPRSPQAELMYKLGLKRYPPVQELFRATHGKKDLAKVALKYYLRYHEEAHYSKSVTGRLDIAFIPTKSGKLVRPSECYVDVELEHFGFEVILPSLGSEAEKLGVQSRPSVHVLVAKLLRSPPKLMSDAEPQFSYLSTRVNEMSRSDIESCQAASFIPVSEKSLERPSQVFLPSDSDVSGGLRSLFPTIHPSQQAIPFLRAVGVQSDPTLPQIVQKTLKDPAQALHLVGSVSRYERLLTLFEANWSLIERFPRLVESLKTSPFLLGVKYAPTEKGGEDGQVALYKPSELAIVDDVILFGQFKTYVPTAPQDTYLENFYSRLGVPKLSSLLREEVRIAPAITTREAERVKLEERIKERLRLFLETTSKHRRKGLSISGIMGQVKVSLTSRIEVSRRLRDSRPLSSHASAYSDARTPFAVFVVPDSLKWLDVSRALVKGALEKPDPESVLVLEMQLSNDLQTLEEKGYNVARLQKRHRDLDALKLSEPQRQPVPVRAPSTNPPPYSSKSPSPALSGPVSSSSNESSQALSQQSTNQSQGTSQSPVSQPAPQQPAPQQPAPQQPAPQQPAPQQPAPQQSQPPVPSPVSQPPNLPAFAGFGKKLKDMFTPTQHSSQQLTQQPSRQVAQSGDSNGATSGTTSREVGTNVVTQQVKEGIDRTLQRGIGETRPFNPSHLRDTVNVDAQLPDRAPMCAAPQSYDLVQYSTLPGGMKTYVSRNHGSIPSGLPERFETVLQPLANMFGCAKGSVSIFYDEDITKIAFNKNGSLFFNSAVYQNNDTRDVTALQYWFPVMAHELAHNLSSSHGQAFSFYSESYIQKYLGRFTALSRNEDLL